jgi:glycerol-3-phosphate acyltransferase PlsX
VVIKSHGAADQVAFGFALERARQAVVSGLLARTTEAINQLTKNQVDNGLKSSGGSA